MPRRRARRISEKRYGGIRSYLGRIGRPFRKGVYNAMITAREAAMLGADAAMGSAGLWLGTGALMLSPVTFGATLPWAVHGYLGGAQSYGKAISRVPGVFRGASRSLSHLGLAGYNAFSPVMNYMRNSKKRVPKY
jgi:hypothetical protein